MLGGRYNYLTVFFLALMIVSCVKDPKDIPSGVGSDADFGMKASFGNEVIEIAAGTDLWTMLPVVEKEDSLDVYTAIFSLDGCLDQCAPSWSFRFYQALPDQTDAVADFNSTIRIGEKNVVLSDQQLDSIGIQLSTHPGLFMSGYSYWQEHTGPASFFYEYETVLAPEDDLNICFESLAITGCNYSQCIYFQPATQIPCLAYIEARFENDRHLILTIRPSGTPPFQYEWFTEAITQNIVIPIQDSISEVYATVKVTDSLGNRTQLSQTIKVQYGLVDACYFPIDLTSEVIENTSTSVYADNMEVVYTDETGTSWSTSGGIQPSASRVTIDAIQGYGLSPFDQPASLVDLTAKMMLYSEVTGEGRWFETQQLTIALSHP